MNMVSVLPFFLLLILIATDIGSKLLAIKYGTFWANPGLILGSLSDLQPFTLILSLGAFAAFLFLVFVCLQIFLAPKVLGLKLGISFVCAGIFGNMIDKALRGWTIDWIFFSWLPGNKFAFNLADVFLWIGILIVLWWLIKREKDIWYPGNIRKRIWLQSSEQLSFSLRFTALVGGMCGMVGFFSFTFIKQAIMYQLPEKATSLGNQYLIVFGSLSLLLLFISFWIGVWISHKFLGPIIAFERYIKDFQSGKIEKFRLREGDMLKKLEEIASLITKCLVVLIPLNALAYPQYISMQYTSCLTCHFNPLGNGPLNDYGRGVGATAIAGRTLVSSKTSEEDLVKGSSFPGINPETNKWLRPMLGYRGLALERGAFSGASQKQWITMQLDANLVIKGGDRDQYIASFTYGTEPLNRADSHDVKESKGYSREHYLGWRMAPQVGVYVGKMDKAYGLRIPDHNLTSRRETSTAQFDQVHGVMLHAVGDTLEGSIHYFVGDQDEKDKDLHNKGFSGILEWGVSPQNRLGISAMRSRRESAEADSTYVAIHDRLGLGKGHSLMAEGGIIKVNKDDGSETNRTYGLLQTHLMITRGMWFQGTFDYFRADHLDDKETITVGPGLQWFPRQKLELRLDIYNRRSFADREEDVPLAKKDAWSLLGQVHIWL